MTIDEEEKKQRGRNHDQRERIMFYSFQKPTLMSRRARANARARANNKREREGALDGGGEGGRDDLETARATDWSGLV
jgi:hypothetical protein